ncbi:MAG: tetratricopeptide repeat protein [Treponemataceae bacterium]|nr:tetratricopeptide repeat protein [Treponemataceae bacterium]
MRTYGVCMVLLAALTVMPLYAQRVSASSDQTDALMSGYEAYRNEDWTSAMFFFRKTVSVSDAATDETWYMLVMSEVFAGEYRNALDDCESFLRQFPFSQYVPYIQYQRGRTQHYLQQNENAILTLSDFCHQYPDHSLYASALYWIAESFYAEYNYDAARALYERIVTDFPRDAKVGAAQYRIDAIDQKGREEKLLYLLKVTGEENLAAREEYERQLRVYAAEDKFGLQQRLADAQKRIADLEDELANHTADTPALDGADGIHDVVSSDQADGQLPLADPDVELLKRKARQLQYMLDDHIKTGDAK